MIFLRIALALAFLACAVGSHAQIAFRAASQGSSAGTTPAFVATASTVVNAASVTVAQPAGIAQDDVLIAQVTVKGTPAITAPGSAGDWNLVDLTSTSTAGNQMTQAVYWRRVGPLGSEAASYTWSFSAGGRATAAITAYRNAVLTGNPINVSGVRSANAAASMTLPTITTTQNNTLLVALLGSSRAGIAHGIPTAMTLEEYEINSGGGPNGVTASLDEQAQPVAGSSGAKTATMSSSTDYVAHLLALAGGSSLSLSVPSGTAVGDVMVAGIAVRPCTAALAPCTLTVAPPAGWTLRDNVDQTTGGGVGNRLAVYWRIATAADPGTSYTWTFAGTPVHTGAAGGILSFSGVDTTSPVVASAGQATASSSSHAAPSINTGTVTNTVLVSSHAVNASGNWTPPGGMTEQVDVASLAVPNNAGMALEMNWQAQAAAGATGARTATLSNPPSGNTGATHMLALRPAVTLSHYAIAATGTTVATCDYVDVTITGHNVTHGSVVPPAGRSLSVGTSTATGVWQVGPISGTGAWTPSGSNDGAATYVWPGGEASVTVRLRHYAVISLNINVNDGSAVEDPTEDPTITFVDSALRISNGSGVQTSIGTQIAGKPSNTGFGQQALFLQAVTSGGAGACGTLLPTNTDVPMEVGAVCNNPASCSRSVTLTSGALASNTATFAPNGGFPATMNFRFTTANSEAAFALNYADAGQITLQFRKAITGSSPTQYVQGSSNAFVTRPFGFAFRGANALAAIGHGTDQNAALLAAAGDNFTITLGAYTWASGQDADNDGVPDAGANLAGNSLTPNFAAATTVDVDSAGNLAGQPGAIARAIGGNTLAASDWTGGAATAADWRYSEVGNVFLKATANDYLGDSAADIAGNSGLDGTGAAGGYVGRFRPKSFVLSNVGLTPRSDMACAPASAFTYMDEGMKVAFKLTAQNAQGTKTSNYTGAYAKHDPTTGGSNNPVVAYGMGGRSGTTDLTGRVRAFYATTPPPSWLGGELDLTGANAIVASIARNSPDDPDGPYPALQLGLAASDGETAMNALDLDVNNDATNDHKVFGVGTEVRFGRLRLDNAFGNELHRLQVPMQVEYWNGSGFVKNGDDSCTSIPRSAIALTFDAPAVSQLAACETAVDADPVTFSAGVAPLGLSAPGVGNRGGVVLTVNLGTAGGSYCDPSNYVGAGSVAMPYLLGRWNSTNDDGNANTAYDDKPAARAGFGVYGSQPGSFIYFRERY